MNRLYDAPWVRHAAIALGLIILSQVAANFFRKEALKRSKEFLAPLAYSSVRILNTIERSPKIADSTSRALLSSHYRIIGQRKEHRKRVFIELYQYHFASVTMLLMISTIFAVVGLIVAQNGIKNASPYVQTVFYTLAALTSFYALSPVVYKQDEMIKENLSTYTNLDNLQIRILNYAMTGADTTAFSKFNNEIVKEIIQNNGIDLEFDYKSIKVPEIPKDVQSGSGGGQGQ